MEDVYLHDFMTKERHLAITDLRVGGVIWGDTEPGYIRAPAPDPSSAVRVRCLIDTGANWCVVSTRLVDDLSLITFDAPPPVTLGPPQERQEPFPATCITVVVGRRALSAPAYIRMLPVSADRYDALIGTTVLQFFRFTYDGPEGAFSLGPV